jgi:hypothetical protein
MYKREIDNLIKNLEVPKSPIHIDLVLEGGSFNGAYHIGVLLFLRELENKNIIKINRVSGVSVGSYCALMYLTNNVEKFITIFKKVRENWKKKQNLMILKKILKDYVYSISDDDFNNIKKDKLFICYNNIKLNKKIVKSNYKNRDELIKALEHSSYIPHISNKDFCNEGFFIDGGMPFIFENREKNNDNKILYVSISQLSNIKNMIITKDINGTGRVLYGILKCYEFFFHKKNNNMCSFVNDWSMMDYFIVRGKQIIVSILIYLLIIFYYLKNYIDPYIKKNKLYLLLKPIFNELYKDILLQYCF